MNVQPCCGRGFYAYSSGGTHWACNGCGRVQQDAVEFDRFHDQLRAEREGRIVPRDESEVTFRSGTRVWCPLPVSRKHGVVVRPAIEKGKVIVKWDGEDIPVPVRESLLEAEGT